MTVRWRPGESQEELLKRFRKKVSTSKILSTFRQKRWFVSKSDERRRAKAKAIRKARRKQARRQSTRRGRRRR